VTDIVERLRKAAEDFEQMRAHAANMVDSDCEPHWSEQQEMAEASLAAREAAAEIERLRQELADARDNALDIASAVAYRECAMTRHVKLCDAVPAAILALKGEKG